MMPMPLHVFSEFPFFLFLWTLFTLYSSQISSVLTKLFLCLLLNFTHGNNHGFFFFFGGQKLLQSIILSPCSGCSFLLLFFFLFLSKKISQKLSLLKRKFCLKLSRTLMRVQRLIECYGWSFNNGDLVLWVCNFFFLLIKIALIWTARTVHGS